MKLKPISDELVDLVTYTANQIGEVKAEAVTIKDWETRRILQALRLVNDLIKKKEEDRKWTT